MHQAHRQFQLGSDDRLDAVCCRNCTSGASWVAALRALERGEATAQTIGPAGQCIAKTGTMEAGGQPSAEATSNDESNASGPDSSLPGVAPIRDRTKTSPGNVRRLRWRARSTDTRHSWYPTLRRHPRTPQRGALQNDGANQIIQAAAAACRSTSRTKLQRKRTSRTPSASSLYAFGKQLSCIR